MENTEINLVILIVGIAAFLVIFLTQQRKVAFANVENLMNGLATNFNLHLRTSYGWLNQIFNAYPSVYSLNEGRPIQAFINEETNGRFTEYYFCIQLENTISQYPAVVIEKKSSLKKFLNKTFKSSQYTNDGFLRRFKVNTLDQSFTANFFKDETIKQLFQKAYSDIRGVFEVKDRIIEYKELVQLHQLEEENQARLGRLMFLVQQMAVRQEQLR